MIEHDVIVFRFLLEARCDVDHISYGGVVLDTVTRTDIAYHRLARIYTYSKRIQRIWRLSSLILQNRHAHLPGRAYCTQHMIFLWQRRIENCHQRISPESGNGAFFIPDLFDHNFQVGIEQGHHFFRSFTFVQTRKVPKIGSDNRNFFCLSTQVESIRILDKLLYHIGMDETPKNASYILGPRLGAL